MFVTERERQSMSGEGTERERKRERKRETESKAGSRLPEVSTEPDAGLEPANREITT